MAIGEREWPWLAATFVFILLRFHIILATPLLGSEAYYWDWGQHPAWGYFDHPPGVAVMIRLTSALFGNTNLGVRLGPLILGSALPFLVQWVAGILYGRQAGRTAAFLTASAPLVVTAGVLATPDAPVTVLFVLALGTGLVAARRWSPVLFFLAGLLTGLSILAKFNGFGLVFILGLLWLLEARKEPRAKRWFPLIACLGLVVLIPYLRWNAGHDWVTFKYLFWGRHRGAAKHLLNWTGPIEFAADFFTLGPLLGALMVFAVYRWFRTRGDGAGDSRDTTELVIYILPLAGFLALSFKISMAPHWVGQVLLIGLMVTTGRLLCLDAGVSGSRELPGREGGSPSGTGDAGVSGDQGGPRRKDVGPLPTRGPGLSAGSGRWRGILVLSGLVNVVLCGAVYLVLTNMGPLCRLSAAVGTPIRADWASEFFGWDEFAKTLGAEIAAVREDDRPVFIMASQHRLASLARFYAGAGVYASVIAGDRHRQFEFWPGPDDIPHSNGVYVDKEDRESRLKALGEEFRTVDGRETLAVTVGACERTFYFWRLYDSRGPGPPEEQP